MREYQNSQRKIERSVLQDNKKGRQGFMHGKNRSDARVYLDLSATGKELF